MKKRSWLWPFIVFSSLVVCLSGVVLKYGYLESRGDLRQIHAVELVVRCITDPVFRNSLNESSPESDQTPPETTTIQTTVPEATTGPETILTPMDDEWFDDVLFIGDSRTVGLRDVVRSGKADYFCSVGMTVFDAMKTEVSDIHFEEQKLENLLSSRTYGKIIITLGINECGNDLKTLMNAYQALVEQIRTMQPEAKIILQSIMMVGRKKAAQASHFGITNLRMINEKIQGLANGIDVFYIDCNEEFTDDEGYLPDDMSSDGCHLYGKYDVQWEHWIRNELTSLRI